MSWEPILDGELAERARGALRDLADGLATYAAPIEDLALFWSYVAPVLGDAYDDHHNTALARLGDVLDRGVHGPGLYNGLAGLGWTVAHCTEGADELLDVVDAQLVDALRAHREWPGHYDLISGLAGLAVYFFERGEAPLARVGLDAITDHFARTAERTGDLVTWHTDITHVPPHEHARHPTGWYNCGVAHGVPGVIAVLGKLPEPTPEAIALRDGAIRWLLAQHAADPARSRFPTLALPDHSSNARTAWCYGDPGIVAVLFAAHARARRDTAPFQELALEVLARPVERTGVVDAPLCHGAVGLAHIANRLFHATANVQFRELARRWYATALDFAKPGTGIGGFSAWKPTGDSPGFHASASFLDGAAGVGLALAAALSPVDPDWDRLLLLDLPVAS